jgi:hypothetical protein
MKVVQINKEKINGHMVIKGRVVDEHGKALPGVNVLIAGTSTGTATDTEGLFRLVAPTEKGRAVFTFVGYNTVEESF